LANASAAMLPGQNIARAELQLLIDPSDPPFDVRVTEFWRRARPP
jgi:hypothetical protein